MGAEVDVTVTYLTVAATIAKNQVKHVFKYTSGAAYMTGAVPTVLANYRAGRR